MMLGEQEISDEEVNAIKVLRGPRRSLRMKQMKKRKLNLKKKLIQRLNNINYY